MGASLSISQKTLDDLKSVSEKLKSKEEVKELETQVYNLIKETQDKINKQGDATTKEPEKTTDPEKTTASEKTKEPEKTTEPAAAAQTGGKRLKKRRISNKKRVRHRLTRSLKLI